MEWKETSMNAEQLYEKYGDNIKVSGEADKNFVKADFEKPTKEDWESLKKKYDEMVAKILKETGETIEVHETSLYVTPTHVLHVCDRQICAWDTDILGEGLNNVISDLCDSDTDVWSYQMWVAIIDDVESLFNDGFIEDQIKMINSISITKDEEKVLRWALDVMDDYWNGDMKEEEVVPKNHKVEIPKVESGILIIPFKESFIEDVLKDLNYRITDQIQSMQHHLIDVEEKKKMQSEIEAGKTASEKIKKVIESL